MSQKLFQKDILSFSSMTRKSKLLYTNAKQFSVGDLVGYPKLKVYGIVLCQKIYTCTIYWIASGDLNCFIHRRYEEFSNDCADYRIQKINSNTHIEAK